jgi:hypothetical protein
MFEIAGQIEKLIDAQAVRIKELEAECDRLQAELRVCYKLPLTMGHPIAQKLAAERDAIAAASQEKSEEIARLEKYAGELQAERDKLAADARRKCELVLQEAKRADAIEAATIERILLLIPGGTHCDPQEIADSIRALAKPSAESE